MRRDGDRTGPSSTHGSGPQTVGRTGRRERRGQTTIDFAIGIGIFLLALTFVLTFVPGMLDPFTGGSQSETPAVNRVADDLTQRTLSNASAPFILNGECTAELFTAGAPPTCRFDGATLSERVGILERTPVNVTIRGDLDDDGVTNVLCWDASASPSTLVERSAGCGTVLSGGSNPAGSGGRTVSATRVALLDGHDVTLEVVMW